MLCSGTPAVAITVDARAQEPEPVDRVVNITSSDLISIRSFYHRRSDDDAGEADGTQQLWGFAAESSLPVSAAHAQLEYSLWVPPESGQAGFEDANRLVRLRLNDHRRYFDYGANFFAVGDAFAANAMARQRLNAVGLPGPGEGSEYWITGRLPGLALEPRFRRLEKAQGNINLLDETLGLSYGHRIGGSRLIYLLESSASSRWFEEAATAAHAREATMATVRVQRPEWTMMLKSTHFDEALDAGARHETGSVWELGATVDVISGLRLSPRVSDQIRDVGSDDCMRISSAGLTLHTTWMDPVALDLNVQRDRRHGLDGSVFQATAADLKVRTPLRLWERSPAEVVMTASLGYRDRDGAVNLPPDEGVSFRLTLDFHPRL